VYWADAGHPVGSLYRMRKFRNVSAENNAVTRVAGHLSMLTDVFIRHELRQPTGLLMTEMLAVFISGRKFHFTLLYVSCLAISF